MCLLVPFVFACLALRKLVNNNKKTGKCQPSGGRSAPFGAYRVTQPKKAVNLGYVCRK
jgi:hypothetical protein